MVHQLISFPFWKQHICLRLWKVNPLDTNFNICQCGSIVNHHLKCWIYFPLWFWTHLFTLFTDCISFRMLNCFRQPVSQIPSNVSGDCCKVHVSLWVCAVFVIEGQLLRRHHGCSWLRTIWSWECCAALKSDWNPGVQHPGTCPHVDTINIHSKSVLIGRILFLNVIFMKKEKGSIIGLALPDRRACDAAVEMSLLPLL